MPNKLIVSVGMTTYNSSKYIKEQLDSILNQTVLPDEIVIYDDCSTDNTVDILNEYSQFNSNVKFRIVVNNKNIGWFRNFEQCFLNCTGDIIISCDADDVWFPDKVEKLLNCFEDTDVVYAWHDAIVVDAKMNIINPSLNASWDKLESREDSEQILLRCIKRHGFPSGMSMAFRRNILGTITPFEFAHDEWIYMCSALLGKVKYINEPLTYYRRHGNNTSGSNGENILYRVTHTPKSSWLDWPCAYTKSYSAFYKKFGHLMPESAKNELESQIKFRSQLSNVETAKSKIAACFYMLKVNKKLYKKYRGPWKLFILDVLNIIVESK